MTIAPIVAAVPGFGLTLGFSLAYLTLIIVIPLWRLVWRSAALGWADFLAIVADRRTINAPGRLSGIGRLRHHRQIRRRRSGMVRLFAFPNILPL